MPDKRHYTEVANEIRSKYGEKYPELNELADERLVRNFTQRYPQMYHPSTVNFTKLPRFGNPLPAIQKAWKEGGERISQNIDKQAAAAAALPPGERRVARAAIYSSVFRQTTERALGATIAGLAGAFPRGSHEMREDFRGVPEGLARTAAPAVDVLQSLNAPISWPDEMGRPTDIVKRGLTELDKPIPGIGKPSTVASIPANAAMGLLNASLYAPVVKSGAMLAYPAAKWANKAAGATAAEFTNVSVPALRKATTAAGRKELLAAKGTQPIIGEELASHVSTALESVTKSPEVKQMLAEVPAVDIEPVINKLVAELPEGVTKEGKVIADKLTAKADELMALTDETGKVPAEKLFAFRQEIDDIAADAIGAEGAATLTKKLNSINHEIRAALVKSAEGTPYAATMAETSGKLKAIERMNRLLGSHPDTRAARAESFVRNIHNLGKTRQRAWVEDFERKFGGNYLKRAEAARYADELGGKGTGTIMSQIPTGKSVMATAVLPFGSPVIATRMTLPMTQAMESVTGTLAGLEPKTVAGMLQKQQKVLQDATEAAQSVPIGTGVSDRFFGEGTSLKNILGNERGAVGVQETHIEPRYDFLGPERKWDKYLTEELLTEELSDPALIARANEAGVSPIQQYRWEETASNLTKTQRRVQRQIQASRKAAREYETADAERIAAKQGQQGSSPRNILGGATVGGLAGSAAGAQLGDTPEQRTMGAMMGLGAGMVLGGAAGVGLSGEAKRIKSLLKTRRGGESLATALKGERGMVGIRRDPVEGIKFTTVIPRLKNKASQSKALLDRIARAEADPRKTNDQARQVASDYLDGKMELAAAEQEFNSVKDKSIFDEIEFAGRNERERHLLMEGTPGESKTSKKMWAPRPAETVDIETHISNSKAKGAVLTTDTSYGCPGGHCVSCYAGKLGNQQKYCHLSVSPVTLTGDVRSVLKSGEDLRIGTWAEPNVNPAVWKQIEPQYKALVQKYQAMGKTAPVEEIDRLLHRSGIYDWAHTNQQLKNIHADDPSLAKQVFVITKLHSLKGFDPAVIRNLEVSIDPMFPSQFFNTLKNIEKLKKIDPTINVIMRTKSIPSMSDDINSLQLMAARFAKKNGLKILDTPTRLNSMADLAAVFADGEMVKQGAFKPAKYQIKGVTEKDGNLRKVPGAEESIRKQSTFRPFAKAAGLPEEQLLICNKLNAGEGACKVCGNCKKAISAGVPYKGAKK